MGSGPKVVVIGAGIVGCSLADELTERGWTDLTVLDQGPLFRTGGSSSHAPGMLFQTNGSKLMTDLARYTVEKFRGLPADVRGLTEPRSWTFRTVGSLELALTEARRLELHRRQGWAASWGLEGRVIDPDEAVRMAPLVDRGAITGAYHVPSDGITHAVLVSEIQARRAMERGAAFVGGAEVTGIRTGPGGRVTAVETADGRTFPADLVVCAAGIWGPKVGRLAGVTIALQPLAHQFTRTSVLPELAAIAATPEEEALRPILRIQDRDLYARELGDRMGVGGYGHVPLPIESEALLSPQAAPVMPSVLPFTPDTFAESWAWAGEVIPALRRARIEEGMNGVFSFTPDGMPLMGESREVPGFWLCEAVWVTHSAGVARAMAEWLVTGTTWVDVHEADLHRFEAWQRSPAFIRERGVQNYVEVYDIVHPLQPMGAPRPLRLSPFHEREAELGAMFLEGAGWERPHWYETNASLVRAYRDRIPERHGWSAQYWSPIAAAEALATRDGVAMYDMSSLKRLEVRGPGALAFLDGLTTNRLDRPVGSVVYTLLLDEAGGIRSDLTIARLAADRFQIGGNGELDLDWLQRHAPLDGSVVITDLTAGTCVVGLWGPRARDVLAARTDADVSNEAFGYFRARELYLGHVPVTAIRVSYVGELGWELYTTADLGRKLWDELRAAGRDHGLIAAGRAAFASLRLEKGYRSWGTDMTTEHDPFEAGLGFAVRMDKGDFFGRAALERRQAGGGGAESGAAESGAAEAARRLVTLTLEDPAEILMGREPVSADGRVIGYVTSAGFGYSVGRSIALAWLPAALAAAGTSVTVASFDRSLGATVAADALFDPEGRRLRA